MTTNETPPQMAVTVEQAAAYNAARDPIHDILRPLHYEAWKAGVFTAQGDWPDDDEQESLERGIDSVAVGEHYEAWASDAVEQVLRLAQQSAATGGDGPYSSQADAWNDALEKSAEIVERYNASFADPECGGAPDDIRALKRLAAAPKPTHPSDMARENESNPPARSEPEERANSYSDAFYELGKMMGIPAQSKSPSEVWATQMLPRLRATLANPAGEGGVRARALEKMRAKLQHLYEWINTSVEVPTPGATKRMMEIRDLLKETDGAQFATAPSAADSNFKEVLEQIAEYWHPTLNPTGWRVGDYSPSEWARAALSSNGGEAG